jgi:hypothetical protein
MLISSILDVYLVFSIELELIMKQLSRVWGIYQLELPISNWPSFYLDSFKDLLMHQ